MKKKNSTRRRAAALGMILALALTLMAGCGSSAPSAQPTQAAETQAAAQDTQATAEETAVPAEGTTAAEGPDGETAGTAEEQPETGEASEGPAAPRTVRPVSVQTGAVRDYHWEDSLGDHGGVTAEGQYPIFGLDPEDAQRLPELADAIGKLAAQKEESGQAAFRDLTADAAREMQEAQSAGREFGAFYDRESVLVRRADDAAVSLLFRSEYFAGGPHGSLGYEAAVLDAQTGKQLALTDVVTDMDRLARLAEEELGIFYAPEDLYPEGPKLAERFASKETLPAFTLDPEGLTLYFDPDEIGPYSSGPLTVTILYGDQPGLVKEAYTQAPAGWTAQLDPGLPYYTDLDGDGVSDRVCVEGKMYEDGDAYEVQTIWVNGHYFEEEELYTYAIDPVLVRTADGRSFLYIEYQQDNDYHEIQVYRVETGTTAHLDTIGAGWGWRLSDKVIGDYGYRPALDIRPSDPDEILLSERTDLLSTVTGRRAYRPDAEGVPRPAEDMLDLTGGDGPLTFTARQDVTGVKVGADGAPGDETVIPAGTKVEYIRTDGMSRADLRLPDGTAVRVTVDTSDWPRTVNGVDIEELFDGILFAG